MKKQVLVSEIAALVAAVNSGNALLAQRQLSAVGAVLERLPEELPEKSEEPRAKGEEPASESVAEPAEASPEVNP
jgi:hypothetical protein